MQTLQAADLIGELLKLMLEKNSSDLFINAGFPPAIKVDGETAKRSPDQLSPEHTAALVRAVMSERQLGELETTIEFVHLHKNGMVTQREVKGIKGAMKKAATRACKLLTRPCLRPSKRRLSAMTTPCAMPTRSMTCACKSSSTASAANPGI